MIKYYCDKCGVEVKQVYQEKGNWLFLRPYSSWKKEEKHGKEYFELGDFMLCEECAAKFKDFLSEGKE